MATIAEIEARIVEAEAKRHDAALGNALLEVWKDGRRMKLAFDLKQLNEYIAGLKRELITAQTAAGITPARTRRPIAIRYS